MKYIAASMVHGPESGLEMLATLDGDPRMKGTHRVDAVRAHLLEKAGDHEAAVESYLAAARRTKIGPERCYLERRAARLTGGSEPG